MLYHMLSGMSPLYETRDRITRLSVGRYRDVKPLGQEVPDCPNYIIALVNKSMDLNADRRYQAPGEMLEDLERAIKRVKAGDKGTYVSEAAATKRPADDLEANGDSPLEREGEDATVMLVESSVSMQDTMRNALKKRGYRVLVFGDAQRALQRFEEHLESERLADCVIFSAGELGDDAVDAFNAFGEGEETRDIPAILLVKRDNKDQIRRAKTSDRRIMLPIGLKIKQLRAKLLQLRREADPDSISVNSPNQDS